MRRSLGLRAGILAILSAAVLSGAARSEEMPPDDPQQAYMKSMRELMELFKDQKYEEAAKLCRKQIEWAPERSDPRYNLACALARMGKKDEAFAALAKAIEIGYGDSAHMKEDDDLSSLREDKRFADLAANAEENRKKAVEKLYEKGAEIPGVKTIEGDPEGGLRWRLRMGEGATAEKPNRLIVWLHPSGGSMNRQAEALSPGFVKRGFALLVLTQKQWMGWTPEEGKALMEKTLPDAAKVPGLDASRPLLLGYSAGGQAALTLYLEKPGRFGGLILDAAYPIDVEAYQQGKVEAARLPDDPEVKKVPMFVLVGDQDGGSKLWQKVEPDWTKAGVPLKITYVAGRGHTWLFGEEQLKALGEWLDALNSPKTDAPRPEK